LQQIGNVLKRERPGELSVREGNVQGEMSKGKWECPRLVSLLTQPFKTLSLPLIIRLSVGSRNVCTVDCPVVSGWVWHAAESAVESCSRTVQHIWGSQRTVSTGQVPTAAHCTSRLRCYTDQGIRLLHSRI